MPLVRTSTISISIEIIDILVGLEGGLDLEIYKRVVSKVNNWDLYCLCTTCQQKQSQSTSFHTNSVFSPGRGVNSKIRKETEMRTVNK